MDDKNFTKALNSRINRKMFNTTKEKDKVFFSQSLSRLNSMIDVTYTKEELPEYYSNMIVSGVEILYLKNTIINELGVGKKKEVSERFGALLTVLTHLENVYLQEIQLLKRED